MEKMQVEDILVKDNDATLVEKEIILHLTYKSVLLYEEMTGSNFFKDYGKALKGLNIDEVTKSDGDINVNQAMNIMTNEDINNFVLNAIPALYAEVIDGRFVQSEMTYDKAKNSSWLLSVANVSGFMVISNEISKGNVKTQNSIQSKKK